MSLLSGKTHAFHEMAPLNIPRGQTSTLDGPFRVHKGLTACVDLLEIFMGYPSFRLAHYDSTLATMAWDNSKMRITFTTKTVSVFFYHDQRLIAFALGETQRDYSSPESLGLALYRTLNESDVLIQMAERPD